jgi:predicted DsbA family dithiol-disulfide isomerase
MMQAGAVPREVVSVDVVSDVVCPWCYIGKRRLERALSSLHAREPDVAVTVRWHPFELNPDLPTEGVDRKAYLEAKFGGPERAVQIYDRVRAAGRTVELPLALEAIARQPNTRDAHRLIAWAQQQRDAGDLVERLFRAYFVEGRLVGDRAELARLAAEAGYDGEATRAFLASPALVDEVDAAQRRAREMGVGGVPFFVFNGKVALSGAQEPDVMLQALAQARRAQREAGATIAG